MMSIWQAVVLGVVQGLAEFLPISSSGHLILIPNFFNWPLQTLAFDTVLHLGTAGALLVYFWRDILVILKNKKYLKLVLIGSLPAALLGFFLGDFIENAFRSAFSVSIFLLAGTLIIYLAEKTYKKVWHSERLEDAKALDYKKATLIGIFQSLALFSGISRSGATISGGMFSGLTREEAARFSFILSIPIVIGAGAFKVLESYRELSFDLVLLAGFLTSMLTGALAIKYFLRFLKNNDLYPFIYYRLLLAGIVFLTLI